MKRQYLSVIAELMIVNELPNFMEEVESELYINEYLTFEAHVFNAGVVFTGVDFINDLPSEDELNDDEYIFMVEEIVEYKQAIQTTYLEMKEEY